MSLSSVNDPDKPARHPAKDDPRERGEIPRKRDDSEDRQKTPGSRLLTDAKGRHGLSADARPKASMAASAR